MFGLGKKKEIKPAAPAALAGPAGALEKKTEEPALMSAVIPEESFTVMPKQYLPGEKPGQSSGQKLYFLIAGAVLFLAALVGGLYFFLLSPKPPAGSNLAVPSPSPAVVPPPPSESEIISPPSAPSATSTAEQVVASQAFDNANQLAGVLKMTVPSLVANKYGDSLGIAVLTPSDISLPAGSEISGGLFSLYPIGVVFDEPISFELSATSLAASSTRADFYPGYLKGADWEEIAGSQDSGQGWTFGLNKFPSGPLAAVRRTAAPTASSTPSFIGPEPVKASQDTDSDGLTDKEEILLGTNLSAPDTDNDGYQDKAEILNGYSPLAAAEKLAASGLFTIYTNPTYGYKVAYPAKWLADALDQTNKQVLFISDTEEFFEVLLEENPAKKPIVDWYRSQSPTLANMQLNVAVIDGQGAVWSPDGLTLYVGKEGLVYILTYNKGTLEAVNWPGVYNYFYKSFKFGNTASPAPGPEPAGNGSPSEPG